MNLYADIKPIAGLPLRDTELETFTNIGNTTIQAGQPVFAVDDYNKVGDINISNGKLVGVCAYASNIATDETGGIAPQGVGVMVCYGKIFLDVLGDVKLNDSVYVVTSGQNKGKFSNSGSVGDIEVGKVLAIKDGLALVELGGRFNFKVVESES